MWFAGLDGTPSGLDGTPGLDGVPSKPAYHTVTYIEWHTPEIILRDSIRSMQGLGPTMTARGQSIGILIGMLPHTLIMSITVQKTSKYYTTEFDLEEGFEMEHVSAFPIYWRI